MTEGPTDPEGILRLIGKSLWTMSLVRDEIAAAAQGNNAPDDATVEALTSAMSDLTCGLYRLPKAASDTIYDEWNKQNDEFMASADARIVLDRALSRARQRPGRPRSILPDRSGV